MTTYYFADDGNDSNDGLSTGAPKLSLSAAGALVLAGNELLFKAGDRWTLSSGGTGWALTGKVLASECLIGVWNDDVSPHKPLFDGGTYLGAADDANWTHIGSGVWTRAALTATVTRVFAGTTAATVDVGSWGQPMRIRNAGSVNEELEYNCNGSFVLEMYTGSAVVAPPTFYGGLLLIGNGRATAEGIHLLRCQNVTLENLRFANANNTVTVGCQGTNDSDFITLRDIDSYASGRLGSNFRTYNTTAITFATRNTQLIRCMADNKSGPTEDDGVSENWGSNNGMNFVGRVFDTTVVDPIIKGGPRHSALQFQNDGTTTRYVGTNLRVYRTRSDLGYIDLNDAEYCHGLDGDFNGWRVEGLELRGQATRSQLAGTGVLKGVRFTGNRAAGAADPNTDQVLWFQNWTSPDYRAINSIVVESCIIEDPVGAPIAMLEDRTAAGVSVDAAWATDALLFRNNRILDRNPGGGRTYSVDHQVQGSPFLAPKVSTFTDNIFVTALTSPIRHEETSGVFTSRDVNVVDGGYNGSGNVRAASIQAAGLVTYPQTSRART